MNSNSTSEKLTFYELISKYRIEIPIIQRDYAQGRAGKEDIRTNFLNALFEALNGKHLELDFIYGSVKQNVLQPLDGQQRLTTLFLLHWYIACKENKLNDETKSLLSKFTYETRTSSREFCNALVNKGVVWSKDQEISDLIIDTPWFFLAWRRDPTIKSMLTMLESIHQVFKSKENVWEKLNNISFHYIELQNFGLSDDLYIKMNARGKPLTDFENFKAKFEQYIKANNWESDVESTDKFSHKIDSEWTDLFWNYRNEENIFDQQLLNFFRTMAINNYALIGDSKTDNFRSNIDLLRANYKSLTFNQYSEIGCFDKNYFETLKAILNKISSTEGLVEFLPNTPYINEKKLFEEAIKNNLGYADLVLLFAHYQYLASEENIDIKKLSNWMRIIHNLVEGSRPYLFNNVNEYANALRSVSELLPFRNSLTLHISESKTNSLSGFISEQLSEEKRKAKLIIESDEWKKAITKIENHKYFNGQIGFLLQWSEIDYEPNIEKFIEYSNKVESIFEENGLIHFDNFLFERGLLTQGDYLLKKGQNFSFLINNERDISWKRLLRDENEKRDVIKCLIEKVSPTTISTDLENLITNYNDTKDWRYNFIKQPEMIAACGYQKLIRFNENNEHDILLLGSTTTSGYHKEYYSYSLFLEIKRKNSGKDISYMEQRSIQDWKYFEYDDMQIAYDCDLKKFVWTKNGDWENRTVIEDVQLFLS